MNKTIKEIILLQFIMNVLIIVAITTCIVGLSLVSANVNANATPQIVTQEQIRQFCDPSSSHMKFVNADESKICNVPESTPTTPNNSTVTAP
jgi:hypothetical protein